MGCGRTAPKTQLLRIAASARPPADVEDGGVAARAIVDPQARMSGRGAYLCRGTPATQPDERCLALATRRNALARALRRPLAGGLVRFDAELVESESR